MFNKIILQQPNYEKLSDFIVLYYKKVIFNIYIYIFFFLINNK
jgi:hypothetical protein